MPPLSFFALLAVDAVYAAMSAMARLIFPPPRHAMLLTMLIFFAALATPR